MIFAFLCDPKRGVLDSGKFTNWLIQRLANGERSRAGVHDCTGGRLVQRVLGGNDILTLNEAR
jgi:hypothetical protein